ncbi:tetratricopeptide repeat protein [Oligoflexia bacterium]|nr:tetratricopeptide repeat protein [Oligoflexia bacterium]
MPKRTNVLISLLLFLFGIAGTLAAEPIGVAEYQGNPKSIELNEKGAAAAQAQNFKQAEDYFRKALVADPNNLTAVFNLSSLHLRSNDTAKAIALLTKYTKKHSKDAGLFARLGDAYFASKKIELAIENYKAAFETNPLTPGIAAKLGTLFTLTNNLDDAEIMLLEAVKLEPKDSNLLTNLSSVFLANGKPEKAVSTAKRGLQIQATSALYLTLGTAYEILKDYKNSVIALQRAKDLGDTSSELQDKISDLKKNVS